MNVLFFGTYNTKTTPRIQVMIDGLRANGVNVTECNVPLKLPTAARVAILKQPWRLPLLAYRILECWVRLIFRAKKMPKSDLIIIGHLGHFDVHLAKMLFRRVPRALDYMISGSETAKDRKSSGGGLKSMAIAALDEAALNASDIVIVDTEEHYDTLPASHRNKGVVVHVGAPTFWFKTKHSEKARAKNEPLSVAFFGTYTPLQGAPVIGEALRLVTKPMRVTMIGSGQDFDETQQNAKGTKADVTWNNWVDAAQLPSVIAAHDVCLGVFGTGAKASQVVPNKVYQGAAAGCAVITSDTVPQRRILGDAALLVEPGNAKALAHALDALAADARLLAQYRTAALNLANKEFTPEHVVANLLAKVQTV
jgi:glycosyltransferase involved in cell wall biosynthesis